MVAQGADEPARAQRLLDGIMHGSLSSVELFQSAKDIDPVYLFFVFKLVRELSTSPSVDGRAALQRLLELNDTYPEVVKLARKGEQDSVSEWFLDSYGIREYLQDSEQLFAMLHEKLEG